MAEINGTFPSEEIIGASIDVIPTVVAESNAEMIDARIGHNGATYGSMGEAIRTQVSDLWDAVNECADGGGIVEETDPTVPAWAKEETKPTYTSDEVGAVSITKVWENASIDSEVKPQTIALDLSDADFVRLIYRMSTNGSTRVNEDVEVGEKIQLIGYANAGTSSSVEMYTREFSTDANGVTFAKATKKGLTGSSVETDNTKMIPVRIYKIKGVQK